MADLGEPYPVIDFASLKEQLKLLGHSLPDEQIKDILKDMNIDLTPPPGTGPTYNPSNPQFSSSQPPSFLPPLPATHTSRSHPAPAPRASTSGSGSGSGCIALPTLYEEEDAVITRLSTEVSETDLLLRARTPSGHLSYPTGISHPQTLLSSYQHHTDKLTGSILEQSATQKHAHEWYGRLHNADTSNTTSFEPPAPTMASLPTYTTTHFPNISRPASNPIQADVFTGFGVSKVESVSKALEVSDDLLPQQDTHVRVNSTGTAPKQYTDVAGMGRGKGDVSSKAAWAISQDAPTLHQENRPTTTTNHTHGDESDDDDSQVDDILARYYGQHQQRVGGTTSGRPSRTDQHVQPPQMGGEGGDHEEDDQYEYEDAQYEALRHPVHNHQQQNPHSAPGGGRHAGAGSTSHVPANEMAHGGRRGGGSAGGPSLLRLATGDIDVRPVMQRPARFKWDEALRSDVPVAAPPSVIARSGTAPSRAGSAMTYGSGSGMSRTKKSDPVNRYQQLQNTWKRDRFLSTTSQSTQPPGANTSRSASLATTRKPMAFHAYFKALHAAEQASKDMALKMARAQTTHNLAPGSAYVAPTSKRRDALRWETRQRMHGQGQVLGNTQQAWQ